MIRDSSGRAVPRNAPGCVAARPVRRLPRLALAVALAAGVAACKSADTTGARATPTSSAIGARLEPTRGSAANGLITFRPSDGGVTVAAELGSLGHAGRYRIAIHANANCSSPNGFSAGPPVPLAGSSAPAVIAFSANTEGTASVAARLSGMTIDGLAGRSVVVHDGGAGPLDARPGIRNDRLACGAIGAMRPLF